MATTTPNIGLTLPSGTEGWKRSVINGNFMILDTKMGAVGNTPLQTQINTLSSQIAARFNNTAITSMSDLISYFGTYKTGLTRVSNTVGNLLSGHSRTGLCIGFEITSEYSAFIFLDSNGEAYSGWITNATGAVVYNQL